MWQVKEAEEAYGQVKDRLKGLNGKDMKTRYLFGLPFVSIDFYGKETEFIMDTGFNGDLMLPKSTVEDLQLMSMGFVQYEMADGTYADAEIYAADMAWLGTQRRVGVVAVDTDLMLLGMELLQDCKLILEPRKDILSIEKSLA